MGSNDLSQRTSNGAIASTAADTTSAQHQGSERRSCIAIHKGLRGIVPSFIHEVLLEILRLEPWLAAELLQFAGGTGREEAPVRRQSFDLTKMSPVSYQADAVFMLGEPATTALIVEVQLRVDEEKRFTWPYYVATLRARERIPVELLVITDAKRVEDWASSPIPVSHSNWWTPLVIGPEKLQSEHDPAGSTNRSPHLDLLSLVLSQRKELADHKPTITAGKAWQTLETIRKSNALAQETARLYSDTVMRVVPTTVRTILEKMMGLENYEDQSLLFRNTFGRGYEKGIEEGRQEGRQEGREEGLRRGRLDGRAEGLQRSLFTVIDARGLTLTDAQRRRIDACEDAAALERWIERAARAEQARAIFQ
jgi:hypothetical protein